MALQESGEMYLETILILSQNKKNTVRAVDVAKQMGFSKASVSRALAKLKQECYLTIDHEGYIVFTEKGRHLAEKIYERHIMLTQFLMRLGVDEETAVTDACRIEHVISDKTFDAMKKHNAEHQ